MEHRTEAGVQDARALLAHRDWLCRRSSRSRVISRSPGTTQPLAATLTLTSRWVSGYCANVNVRNNGPQRVNGWNVEIRPEGTLTNGWNADVTASGTRLLASAMVYNAVLEVGAATDFGYCATAPTGAKPTVASAAGQIGDPETGYSATLTLDSDWGAGYCASVRVHNDTSSTLWAWTVVIELNASRVTSSWNIRSAVTGSSLTATPLAYDSVLSAGASTSFGFCAQRTGTNYHPQLTFPSGQVTALKAAVYLPRRIATCFIGDPCTPGSAGCIGLRNDENILVEGFVDATFQAVRTSSPLRQSANKEVCVEMVSSAEDRSAILAEELDPQDEVELLVRLRRTAGADARVAPPSALRLREPVRFQRSVRLEPAGLRHG